MDQIDAKEPAVEPEPARRGIVGELLAMMREENKWFLAPIIFLTLAIGLLAAVSATPLGVWIYSLL